MRRNGVAGESQSEGVCEGVEMIRFLIFRMHAATAAGQELHLLKYGGSEAYGATTVRAVVRHTQTD